MRVYLKFGVVRHLRVVLYVSPVRLLCRSFPADVVYPHILLHASILLLSWGLLRTPRVSFLLASLSELRGRFFHFLSQGLQLLLLPLQNPLLLKTLELEIARLERIVFLELLLLVMEIMVL